MLGDVYKWELERLQILCSLCACRAKETRSAIFPHERCGLLTCVGVRRGQIIPFIPVGDRSYRFTCPVPSAPKISCSREALFKGALNILVPRATVKFAKLGSSTSWTILQDVSFFIFYFFLSLHGGSCHKVHFTMTCWSSCSNPRPLKKNLIAFGFVLSKSPFYQDNIL